MASLLTIKDKPQIVDFTPFCDLLIQQFQLVSVAPVTYDQGKAAFESAIMEMPDRFPYPDFRVALGGLVRLMELYLLNQQIIIENPGCTYRDAIRKVHHIAFVEQQTPLTKSHYDIHTIFKPHCIFSDINESKKYFAIYSDMLESYFKHIEVNCNDLDALVNTILQLVNPLRITDAFELKDELLLFADLSIKRRFGRD